MDIIDIQDSSEESLDEEQEEAEEEDLVVLESSSEGSGTEGDENESGKNGEIHIVSDSEDSDNNDIVLGSSSEDEEERRNEPIIFLEPVPDVASTSTGSKPNHVPDFDLEDYEHFVDPSIQDEVNLENENNNDDQGQTSNVGKAASECVKISEENIAIDAIVVSAEETKCNPGPNSLDFKIIGDEIFISVESLEEEKLDPSSVMREIQRRNLKVSESLIFEDWTVKYVSLQILQSLPLENDNLRILVKQLSTCSIDANKQIENRNILNHEETEETEMERFEVSQTREMKRKGIRLPRGWKIHGVKREAEIKSNGGSYSYFRIDWEYKSPLGKIFTDLKKVLSVVKQNAPKLERWEVRKVSAPYVTLRQQYEDELDRILDTDVFAVSGIRPARKFPTNFQHPLELDNGSKTRCQQDDDLLPSRMSATLKANPISLAQQEKMMRKSGPAVQRFHLSKISEVIGDSSEGWFSSKLVAMKFLARNSDKDKDVFSPSQYFSRSGNIVKLKAVNDEEVSCIQDLDSYIQKLHGNEDGAKVAKSNHRPNSKCEERSMPLPNFRRKLARNMFLPQNWFIKKDKRLATIISPQGTVFSDMETASKHIRYLSTALKSTPRKSYTPSKRKLFNPDLPLKTSVIRKLPTASDFPYPCVKKLKLSDQEVGKMLNSNVESEDDSLDELLSDSEDEQS